MDAEEVKERIRQGEDAYDLVYQADPKLIKKFERLDKALIDFLAEVRKHFPDAAYYTASGGFNLILGPSHDEHERPQSELVAIGGQARIGDGDF